MASIEYRIISKILDSGDLRPALKAGLSEDQFLDVEARQIWRFMKDHWKARATTKTLPSVRAIQNRWPAFEMIGIYKGDDEQDDEDAPLLSLIHELKMSTFGSDARSLAAYFSELVEDDPPEAVQVMQSYLTDLTRGLRQSGHLGVGEVVDEAQEHYHNALEGVAYGLAWPWEILTEDTLGKRAGDFIVFYARMKQMKTWVLLYCAVHDYLENNARVLIWSREMNKEKMCLRLASLLAKVDYQLFKKGKLPKKVQRRAWATFKALKNSSNGEEVEIPDENGRLVKRQIILLCGRDAPKKLEEIQGFIGEYQPDIVYLDSFYHIETSNMKGVTQRWHRLAILAEDVKSMAEDEMIPVIAIHQANRLGEKTFGNTTADMADSDVIAREADLIVRIIKRAGEELNEEDYEGEVARLREEAETKRKSRPRKGKPRIRVEREPEFEEFEEELAPRMSAELALVLPGNREGVLDAFTIKAIPGYNFDFISSEYSVNDIEEWIKQDESSKAKANKEVRSGGKKNDETPKFSSKTFKKYKDDKARRDASRKVV